MQIRVVWDLVKETGAKWSDDRAPSMGAALAYYTMFSIAPLLLIVISIAGLLFGTEAARGELSAQLEGLMGERGARAVEGLVESASEPDKSIVAAIVGIVILLVGATTVFAELRGSLDRIWDAPASEKSSGLWKLIRTRLLSFGMILGIGFLLIVSLVFSAMLAALEKWWSPAFVGFEVFAQVLNFVVGFVLTALAFAMIYKLMPRVTIAWRDVAVGASITALLFTLGKYLIGLYLGRSTVASGFGAAGSLAVMLAWVYYSAQIFLLGAEFTSVYSNRFGSRKGIRRTSDDTPAG